jgi:magnesium transporter
MREDTLGLVPGTPVLVDEAAPTRLRLFDYRADALTERRFDSIEEAAALRGTDSVTWVDVVGLSDLDQIGALAKAFGVHPLSLEDVADVTTRPKLDDYGDFVFLVLQMVQPDVDDPEVLDDEQVSIVLGPDFVLTFQERKGDVFDPVRRRLQTNQGRLRKRGADYLANALVDALVDGLIAVVERVENDVEALERDVLLEQPEDAVMRIYKLKRQLRVLHKHVVPQRDAVAKFHRCETPLVSSSTRVYLRDVLDHLEQITLEVSLARETTVGLMDLHLAMTSHRTNEAMGVLTVLTALFAPPTFLAGLYGMNFTWMPELSFWFGYPIALAMMGVSSFAMWFAFRRRGWV